MYVGCYVILLHETTQDGRIACGYLLAFEPLEPCVTASLGHSQREATLAEAQSAHHLGVLGTLLKLVLSHYAQVGHAARHALRDVVVAQVEHLNGEVTALHQQGALAAAHFDAGLGKQGHRVLEESTLRLYCNSQHILQSVFYLIYIYFYSFIRAQRYEKTAASQNICRS